MERISSGNPRILKLYSTVGVPAFFGVVAVENLVSGRGHPGFSLLLILGAMSVWFLGHRAFRRLADGVWLDETSLLVRRKKHEARIDLRDINKIRDTCKWGQPRLVLSLSQPCVFGSEIAFRAKGTIGNFLLLRRNKVAQTLAGKIEALRAAGV